MKLRLRPYICSACFRRSPTTRSLTTTPNATPAAPTKPKPPPPPPQQKTALHALTPLDHNSYWETTPPSASQLATAANFFKPTPTSPALLWSAAKFRTTPTESARPEVAFLGRSNVGKSSVLNAVLGREICYTSSKPGRTREMNAFGIGMSAPADGAQPRIVLLDMPGYGKASRAEWGVEIMKYLKGRRQYVSFFLFFFFFGSIQHGHRGYRLMIQTPPHLSPNRQRTRPQTNRHLSPNPPPNPRNPAPNHPLQSRQSPRQARPAAAQDWRIGRIARGLAAAHA